MIRSVAGYMGAFPDCEPPQRCCFVGNWYWGHGVSYQQIHPLNRWRQQQEQPEPPPPPPPTTTTTTTATTTTTTTRTTTTTTTTTTTATATATATATIHQPSKSRKFMRLLISVHIHGLRTDFITYQDSRPERRCKSMQKRPPKDELSGSCLTQDSMLDALDMFYGMWYSFFHNLRLKLHHGLTVVYERIGCKKV